MTFPVGNEQLEELRAHISHPLELQDMGEGTGCELFCTQRKIYLVTYLS